MLSRGLISLFLSVTVIALNVGCNLKTGDWVAPNDRGRLSYTCLSELDQEVRDFIGGDLKDSKVTDMMSCVRKALDEFSHIGRGSQKGGFKAEELSNFLNLKFLGESKITPEFLTALMDIKVVVVGGDQTFVTNAEFKRLIELTYFVEEEARRNTPYMKVYRNLLEGDEKENLNPKLLNAAKAQLTRTAYNLADLLRSPSGSYKLSALKRLVEQSRIFLSWETEVSDSSSIEEIMEIIEVYKMFSVGSEIVDGEEVILATNWVPFFGTFAEWYGIYLDYVFRLDGATYTKGEGLKDLIRSADESMNLLVSAINNQKESVLKFDLVDRILAQMQKIGAIPAGLRLEASVQKSARYIIEKILRDLSIPLDEAKTEGLRVSHIRELRKEFYTWADGQRYIDRLYEASGRSDTSSLGVYYSQVSEDSLSAGEQEIKKVLGDIEAFYNGSDSRVWIADARIKKENKLKFGQNFDSLTRLNVIKIFSRLLIRGFAQEPRRAKAMLGITEKEAGDFYRESRDLGQDLEFMDRRKENVGARFFKEANLFTFSGNGIHEKREGQDEHLLSFQEAIEQLALVYSGSQLRDAIYDSSLGACISQSVSRISTFPLDKVFGKTLIPKECMLVNLVETDYKLFYNLPGMIEFFEAKGRRGREEFFDSMFDISRPPCTDGSMIEFGELATLATLAHYIEVVFKKHDLNFDGVLDGEEVMKAYANFRGFMVPEVRRIISIDFEDKKISDPDKAEDIADKKEDLEDDFMSNVRKRKISEYSYLSMLRNYDKNDNQKLDASEIRNAYMAKPDYIDLEIAIDLGLDVEEQRVKAIFAFLLLKGRIPNTSSWGDGATILTWEFKHFNEDPHQYIGKCKRSWYKTSECSVPEGDDLKVDRHSILQVLGLLVESTGEPTCGNDPQSKGDQLKNALQNLSSQPSRGQSILPQILTPKTREALPDHRHEKPTH